MFKLQLKPIDNQRKLYFYRKQPDSFSIDVIIQKRKKKKKREKNALPTKKCFQHIHHLEQLEEWDYYDQQYHRKCLGDSIIYSETLTSNLWFYEYLDRSMKHNELQLPNSTKYYIKYLYEEIHRVVNVQCNRARCTHTLKWERDLKAYSFPSKLQRAFRRCRPVPIS